MKSQLKCVHEVCSHLRKVKRPLLALSFHLRICNLTVDPEGNAWDPINVGAEVGYIYVIGDR